MDISNSVINFDEQFPHLPKAPIVEAVIDIRTEIGIEWDELRLKEQLAAKLPDYSKIETLKESRFQIAAGKPNKFITEDLGCVGLKLHCSSSPYIAQFKKGAFVFSRLDPYENWENFSKEAFRLLALYVELLRPSEVQRIGLRFINRIIVGRDETGFEKYYKNPPQSLPDLNFPLRNFLHRDMMQIPGTSYSVNLIKTIQSHPDASVKINGLILDIDVFTRDKFSYNEERIIESLRAMHWAKNKIFFNSLTEKTIEGFK